MPNEYKKLFPEIENAIRRIIKSKGVATRKDISIEILSNYPLNNKKGISIRDIKQAESYVDFFASHYDQTEKGSLNKFVSEPFMQQFGRTKIDNYCAYYPKDKRTQNEAFKRLEMGWSGINQIAEDAGVFVRLTPARNKTRHAADKSKSETVISEKMSVLPANLPLNTEIPSTFGLNNAREVTNYLWTEALKVAGTGIDKIEDASLDIHLQLGPDNTYRTVLSFKKSKNDAALYFEGPLLIPDEKVAKELFQGLFNNKEPDTPLIQGVPKEKTMLRAYDTLMGVGMGTRIALRLRINNNAPNLHNIPWERLHDESDTKNEPLAVRENTPFSRALQVLAPTQPVKKFVQGENLRLLMVRLDIPTGLPEGDPRFGLPPIPADELRGVADSLKQHENLPLDVQAEVGEKMTLDRVVALLEAAILAGKPFHALHLLGHGITLPDGRGALAFYNQVEPEEKLVKYLTESRVSLIVLASCQTALPTQDSALGGIARRLVNEAVPAVVGMQGLLTFAAAQHFSQRFYSQLLLHGEPDRAINAARRTLWLKRGGELGVNQWNIPVLFLRESGRLFEFPETSAESSQALEKLQTQAIPYPAPEQLAQAWLQRTIAGLPTSIDQFADGLLRALNRSIEGLPEEPSVGTRPQNWRSSVEEKTLESGEPELTKLKLPPEVLAQALVALETGKHIILCGPPGTGKTTLAEDICVYARTLGYCDGHLTVTATADWTTFDTIGGYLPGRSGQLHYRPGIFPRAIEKGQWLVLDEINRAEIDKAFGELFTVLSGQGVTLPYEVDGLPVRILPKPSPEPKFDYVVDPCWRIIGTMNIFDKASLYAMSFAFMRRFAFIHVPLPEPTVYTRLIARQFLKPQSLTERRQYKGVISLFVGENSVTEARELGPALAKDVVSYLKKRGINHFGEAFSLFVVPQLDGLEENAILSVYKYLTDTLLAGDAYLSKVQSRVRELYPHVAFPKQKQELQ